MSDLHGQEPDSPAPRPPAALSAGRVGRAHGLDGSFYVTRPRPRLLAAGATVVVAGAARTIVRRAGTERRPIVRLEGISDRAGAEDLRGLELTVTGEDMPRLGEGEWWAHELEGCAVRDGERTVGTVIRMLELPSCEVLEVSPDGGGEPLLVPMVKDAIRAIEPARREIQVDLGFLGLDSPPARAGKPSTTPSPDRPAEHDSEQEGAS
ncbi:MAG: ribosome maturation factor RimM [Solirubrobacteraceae bacterium]